MGYEPLYDSGVIEFKSPDQTQYVEYFNPEGKEVSRVSNSYTVALAGLRGAIVDVQSLNGSGKPGFRITGLPDAALSQATDRIRGAYLSCRLRWSGSLMVVNLAPASVPKKGASLDLAILVATLRSLKHVKKTFFPRAVFFGELGLDGRILPVRGILPMVKTALENGHSEIVVSTGNQAEAKLVRGARVFAFGHVAELVNWLGGEIAVPKYEKVVEPTLQFDSALPIGDFSDVIGQEQAKWSLEIAAAGGHHVLMVGPPGTGKSMLASRMPGIMTELSEEESLEVSSIHSISGTLRENALITVPPFEAPHHSATGPAIIGGGTGIPRPGAVSRAHRGILFMDEAPEFSNLVLQTLRQPLENGEVIIDRAQGSARYPSQFQLIMAANPCPCGMDFGNGLRCICTSIAKRRYFNRLSGPLLDRVDLNIPVESVHFQNGQNQVGDVSAVIKQRVSQAQLMAKDRLIKTPWTKNSQVPGSYYRKLLGSDNALLRSLNDIVDKGFLSLRGADRCIRLSWTLADLEGRTSPNSDDMEYAYQLRQDTRNRA
ncbi:MAG: YifB family Mg chelatase-like AAA ATPase [Bifidobacteriaceae bacterium]|jgi:magnesium chelatase family protein|nr:YifB family Mg chelatase-like AAA ATPase [Bifidobacteriaceae bacterium]